MFAKTFGAEVNALPAAVSEVTAEGVRIGSFEGDAASPQGPLGGADVGGAWVIGGVVAREGDEPRWVPADGKGGSADELFEIILIEITGEGPDGIALVGVGFALVPEDGTEPGRAE